jgi:hypothetical protein
VLAVLGERERALDQVEPWEESLSQVTCDTAQITCGSASSPAPAWSTQTDFAQESCVRWDGWGGAFGYPDIRASTIGPVLCCCRASRSAYPVRNRGQEKRVFTTPGMRTTGMAGSHAATKALSSAPRGGLAGQGLDTGRMFWSLFHVPGGQDIPATGRSVTIPYTLGVTYLGGRWSSFRLMFDRAELMTQLGLMLA